MPPRRIQALVDTALRLLASDTHTTEGEELQFNDDQHEEGGHSEFGVHIEYEDLYNTVIFLTSIYLSGQIASRFLRMPSLVGEIVCGILLGPPLADFVPNPEAWVLLGELGLILLVLEAGIDIDLSTLKLIGTRGFIIAFFGSIIPIGLGMLIAYILNVGDTKAIIAAGAVFGPTSLGIALNILRSGGILNTPVGQLIISAAVIDDMIALVVLSQLEALVGEIKVASIVIPIISALGYLIVGGYLAIFILPDLINKHILSRFKEEAHGKVEMSIMICLLLVLMPATYYCKASYLMGAFIAGLTFCSSHSLHHLFVRQFKRVLQWLMRIFFSASIGFQVPLSDFGKGEVIWQGLVFTLALLGKLGVGFMVPNFTQSKKFTNYHLRDCLITGFSMAAEGEFAFVIAVFAVDDGLISKDLYASVVLAVLLSTIVPPFLLRFTISYYNKKAEARVEQAVQKEMERKHDLDTLTVTTGTIAQSEASNQAQFVDGIKKQTTVFLCIQTQSDSKWGLLHALMNVMAKNGLDIIDHRAWSPRGINTTLVNEVYAQTKLQIKEEGGSKAALDEFMEKLTLALEKVINQPKIAKVQVQRWYPGVVEEITEEVHEQSNTNVAHVHQRLLSEAAGRLERKQQLQTMATADRSVAEILGDVEAGGVAPPVPAPAPVAEGLPTISEKSKPRRRVRQKMRSTPVVGGGLFGENREAKSGRVDFFNKEKVETSAKDNREDMATQWTFGQSNGIAAEIVVKGECYNIRISRDTWKDLHKGFRGQMLDHRGIEMSGLNISAEEDAPVVQKLKGYVRNMPLSDIKEDHMEDVSEMSGSIQGESHHDGDLSEQDDPTTMEITQSKTSL